MRSVSSVVSVLALASAACGGAASPTQNGGDVAGPPDRLSVTPIPHAVAVNVASNGLDAVVAWITVEDVRVAAFAVDGTGMGSPTMVSDSLTPFAHPIERPAVAIRPDGTVDVAFVSHQADGASVFYVSNGSQPSQISGEPRHETNLVHLALSEENSPILSWLEDSTLSVALDHGAGPVERELVDDLTCDCCNPVPVAVGETLLVAYRDYDMVDGEIVRNVAAVRSTDGGSTYQPPIQIADDDWFLSGCPFSGPSVAVSGDDLIVAWMDGRQSVHPDQDATTIWADRSADGGATFGDDVAVTNGGIHRWPVMAVDEEGVVHLVWETEGIDGGLSYASSTDGGRTFSEPVILVEREFNDGGAPGSPSIATQGDNLLVSWADSNQGYVGVWSVGS